jgi:hypothetical protein
VAYQHKLSAAAVAGPEGTHRELLTSKKTMMIADIIIIIVATTIILE